MTLFSRLTEGFFKGKNYTAGVRSIEPGDPSLPKHVAIIMDGNGRWAQKSGLPRSAGHQAGLKRVRELTEECGRLGVKVLTLYAFSTENWKRPQQEVTFLMNLFYQTLQNETNELHKKGVKVHFIGLSAGLDPKLIRLINETEKRTANNSQVTLNLAINYGGRVEIINAIRQLVKEVEEKRLKIEDITEDCFTNYLFTSGQPDPDLIIRTSGEQRISNFLLWQGAYAELFFTNTLWPDFGPLEFREALLEYKKRSRRFGGVKEGGAK